MYLVNSQNAGSQEGQIENLVSINTDKEEEVESCYTAYETLELDEKRKVEEEGIPMKEISNLNNG